LFLPSIEKHLEALPLIVAEAEKQDATAAALWTMQCDAGCQIAKDNMNCLLKQAVLCLSPLHAPHHALWLPAQ